MKLDNVITKLRSLNEPVPTPARLPTEAEVAAAEQRLGIPFHPDYRSFLLQAGDVAFGILEPAMVTPGAGHLDLVSVVSRARQYGVPQDLLPFCEDNDDYYCLKPDGRIIFWSHDGTTDENWPDLAHWIQEVWIEEQNDDAEE